jgi:hypothetical protein
MSPKRHDDSPESAPDVVYMPTWGKVAVIVAAVLLFIVVVLSVDFGGSDEPERPNLIGFDDTTTVPRPRADVLAERVRG